MLARNVLLSLLLVGCVPTGAKQASSGVENSTSDLFVEQPRFYKADEALYQGIVAKVLADEDGFVGSCFTMISLIKGRPEEAVYGQCPDDAYPAEIVHVVASQSIAGTLATQGVQAALTIRTRRSGATIPADDARALRATWLNMISSARVETGTTAREARREHFFYVLRPGVFQGFASGVARNHAQEGKAARFVRLGECLVDVVESSQTERQHKLQALRAILNRTD